MSGPLDFNRARRTVLQARIDRARRRLAEAETDARDWADVLRQFRARAALLPASEAAEARVLADEWERSDAASLAALKADVTKELANAQAELDRLDRR